jgi:hypothetical protein
MPRMTDAQIDRMNIASSTECEPARWWDSDSPFSTVADVEDEYCDACGDAHTCSECTA